MPPQRLIDLAGLRVNAVDFYAAVSKAAAQPNWVVDPDDVIRFAISAAITAHGCHSVDKLLGRSSHERIPPAPGRDTLSGRELLDAARANGGCYEPERAIAFLTSRARLATSFLSAGG